MRCKQISFVSVSLSLNKYAQHQLFLGVSWADNQDSVRLHFLPQWIFGNVLTHFSSSGIIWSLGRMSKRETLLAGYTWTTPCCDSPAGNQWQVTNKHGRQSYALLSHVIWTHWARFPLHCAHGDAEKECDASPLLTTSRIVWEIHRQFVWGACNG